MCHWETIYVSDWMWMCRGWWGGSRHVPQGFVLVSRLRQMFCTLLYVVWCHPENCWNIRPSPTTLFCNLFLCKIVFSETLTLTHLHNSALGDMSRPPPPHHPVQTRFFSIFVHSVTWLELFPDIRVCRIVWKYNSCQSPCVVEANP